MHGSLREVVTSYDWIQHQLRVKDGRTGGVPQALWSEQLGGGHPTEGGCGVLLWEWRSAWGTLDVHSKRMKLDPCWAPYTKINSKWIKALNIGVKTLRRKHRAKTSWLLIRWQFLGMIKAHAAKEKMDKLDSMKIENFCASKDWSEPGTGGSCL
jgi:hypothetical protein